MNKKTKINIKHFASAVIYIDRFLPWCQTHDILGHLSPNANNNHAPTYHSWYCFLSTEHRQLSEIMIRLSPKSWRKRHQNSGKTSATCSLAKCALSTNSLWSGLAASCRDGNKCACYHDWHPIESKLGPRSITNKVSSITASVQWPIKSKLETNILCLKHVS